MLCHAMVSDNVMWWTESVQYPRPQEKSASAAQLKSLFGDSCYLGVAEIE